MQATLPSTICNSPTLSLTARSVTSSMLLTSPAAEPDCHLLGSLAPDTGRRVRHGWSRPTGPTASEHRTCDPGKSMEDLSLHVTKFVVIVFSWMTQGVRTAYSARALMHRTFVVSSIQAALIMCSSTLTSRSASTPHHGVPFRHLLHFSLPSHDRQRTDVAASNQSKPSVRHTYPAIHTPSPLDRRYRTTLETLKKDKGRPL